MMFVKVCIVFVPQQLYHLDISFYSLDLILGSLHLDEKASVRFEFPVPHHEVLTHLTDQTEVQRLP
jgi:hypothetical protein